MDITLREFDGNRTISTELDIKPRSIEVRYDLSEINEILIPQKKVLVRENKLWKSTCMELFLKDVKESNYKELNVSLDGKWNAYEFSGYRTEMEKSRSVIVSEVKSLDTNIFWVRFEFLDKLASQLLINPASVIKNTHGGVTYFAPAHQERPDFHSFNSSAHFCLSEDLLHEL
jgi:hypothetical protein